MPPAAAGQTRPAPGCRTWSTRRCGVSRRTAIGGATAPSPMATRLVAASFLAVSALVAWLTITVPFAARLLQLLIVVSIGYVGWLAWHGARVIRDAPRRAPAASRRPRGRPAVRLARAPGANEGP